MLGLRTRFLGNTRIVICREYVNIIYTCLRGAFLKSVQAVAADSSSFRWTRGLTDLRLAPLSLLQ